MPEGPEVTRVAVQLNSVAQNSFLENIDILSGRYTNTCPLNFNEFLEDLSYKSPIVKGVYNKGKFIWWTLDNGWYIFSTLGMSGSYKLQKINNSRISFDLTGAYQNTIQFYKIFYVDPRNFGTIKFINDTRVLNKKLDELGPDMLNNPCSFEKFLEICRKNNNKSIVKFLMDQKQISGVGNIYKSESLYLAKISPFFKIKDITNDNLFYLYNSIISVLQASYKNFGSTISTYSDLYNLKGEYTTKSKLMVYGQSTDPNGNKVQKVILDDQRTTYFVPNVQC